jgi:putative two-component system response regulator
MSSYRILVVEDDFATGELLKAILEQNDYQVVLQTDGISALKAVAEDRFDLALVDVMLPNLNGFQICERIRDDPQNELMPIIILTVLTESHHRIRALQAGATSFLNKPFDRMELLTQIHSLINLSHKIVQRERFENIVSCFLSMLEIQDPELLAHGHRVARLAEQVAYRMGLPSSVTSELKFGALLHDIGKLCLDGSGDDSTAILGDEPPLRHRHTDCGDRMFSHFHRPLVRAIIRWHHHEGSDADALAQISDSQTRLSVHIVAVCNRFDNLIQANPEGSNAIQDAISLLQGEVRAGAWNQEVYGKLAELAATFGSGLFTVFAP